ncbi:MAG TPA: deoxyribodipyrimidine photo-lyase [Amaricoccus sp.]|uniref:cryptochrome/photolyase family protein n=1 Tax=Amaricoccus sp. TaxID=1872485 RepID=UPI002C5A762C|nr:deoxyribodipyrimidine photo-lyase [Amaricoccus sp.]HMQ94798.1 deoxyribodipyrimidine photo-lyase [Amaricoccus sp.]HMR52414.1 deoxyribodipyrimidine photo-lyase [Amaricoccus sp.]HMR60880.1 deoxyribodipyrimidine photo-lyase [Amaricoccus sp.]HMT99335.1 deoxyribodipyrimidine photo-lyase [Amaricoccus sp.]
MSDATPVLFWFRRDLRLSDNPGLAAACRDGGPVVPVFLLDPETETLGAAARWRLGRSLADLGARLEAIGSRLILRRGPAAFTLEALAAETGARRVRWTRLYAPETVARDRQVKARLTAAALGATSHPGHLLHEPWEVATGAGGAYRVFTPFWRAIARRGPDEPLPGIGRIPAPAAWPASDVLAEWRLGAGMDRGAAVVARHAKIGEAAAAARLAEFLEHRIGRYGRDRDRPDRDGTSGLSENLTWGEISVRTVWHAARRAEAEGAAGATAFLRQLGWRDFAWHLIWHCPEIAERNWRAVWDDFPWRAENAEAERWRRGMTGEPMVDAGMREMYVTGRMHNRVRMLVASYLTKHLMTHWRIGADWFAECLTDWDPASNAMGWQWVAGSGPDAAPFFRVFNPALQAEKFDPEGAYRRRFVAEPAAGPPHADARAYFEAVPRSWGLDPCAAYPEPLVDLKAGRRAALDAYRKHVAASAGGRAPA